jgi:hypothetical protein
MRQEYPVVVRLKPRVSLAAQAVSNVSRGFRILSSVPATGADHLAHDSEAQPQPVGWAGKAIRKGQGTESDAVGWESCVRACAGCRTSGDYLPQIFGQFLKCCCSCLARPYIALPMMTAPQNLHCDSICKRLLIKRRVKALATPTILGASFRSIERCTIIAPQAGTVQSSW